ncbi:histidine kinase [Candidatus Vecturithrix granuli]|uniref:Histidine kinase n=1 Tax=Vecturithrix granuli TaxID=1499967 RepID=A0A081C0B2_VECG1|nr:histidine kinase [Candidatus Vecturithrix granuli]
MAETKHILVIDDAVVNRDVLHDLIHALGHIPFLAKDGFGGLSYMQTHAIDLVLLDILMPTMDGYEVLECMKEDPALRHIPVIMITAVDELGSVVRCIEKGADDYLVKPFNPTLLKARINACLQKKELHDQQQRYQTLIEEHNLHLAELVRQKTHELAQANERLQILDKTKSDFLALIAHELRTPLTGILGAAEMVFEKHLDDLSREKFKAIFQKSRSRLLAILDEALLLAQIEVSGEKFPLEALEIQPILSSAIELTSFFAKSRQVWLPSIPTCNHRVLGENKLLLRAIVALLKTAVKFSNPEGMIQVTCECRQETLSVHIRTRGRSIPEAALPRFFEVFSIANPITPGGDLGLGPAIAERIVKLFNGTVTVKNQDPPGIELNITLQRI